MSQFNFEEYLKQEAARGQAVPKTGPAYKVGYFKLSNDKEEAIVRFNYSSTEQFHFATVHSVKTPAGYKKISCLREGWNDPREKCPLCSCGIDEVSKISQKLYVELTRYVQQPDGTYKPVAEVWEKPAGFAKELASYLQKLGDLRNYVFVITRNGAKGSRDTTYTLMLGPDAIYKPEMFPIDFSAFDGYDLTKHGYYVKTAEEMKTFLETGDFPMRAKPEKISEPIKSTAPAKPAAPVGGHAVSNPVPGTTYTNPAPAPEAVPTHPGVAEDMTVFENPAPASTPAPAVRPVRPVATEAPATEPSSRPARPSYNY